MNPARIARANESTRERTRTSERARERIALCALLLLLCGLHAAAAPLEDYRARVGRASQTVDDLLAGGADADEDLSAADFAAWESRSVEEVRRLLPPKERVEWEGGATEVDNTWLHKELDGWAEIGADESGAKEQTLTRVSERLAELKRRLEETVSASKMARDKEAEKGRLQTILRRPEYNEQAAKGGALQGLWDWIVNLLRKLMPRRAPVSSSSAGLLSFIARIFVYALAVALIVFLIWRYAPLLLSRVGTRRRKSRAREARIVLGERVEADQSAADLIDEAERLARAGDLRGAIRKAYVAVLCELGDRKVIRLARHKTNRDYLNSLRDRAPLYEAMRPLTQGFEQHWYGFAPATDSDWDTYRTLCRRALAG